MTRHWQVELHQARRRVRVLEYLLRRSERPQPERVEARVTIVGQVENLIRKNDMQTFRQLVEQAKDCGIAENSVAHALKSLAESGRAVVKRTGQGFGKWSALTLMLLCAGCQTPVSNPPPRSVAAMPALPRALTTAQSIAAPVKTNGVVTLKWSNGDPADTVIVNQTTGAVYPSTDKETLTVGGLPIGSTQTFVATNASGASLPASTVVTPDTLRLQVQTWLYLTWPGPAGTLQRTTNMVIWQDVQPIISGGSYIVTNVGAKAFYRVKF